MFKRLLPTAVIRTVVQATGRRFYERLFTPMILLWGFIFQRLNADHSCDAVISHLASGALDDFDTTHDQPLSMRMPEDTSAYCQGRQRLPLTVVQQALAHTAQTIRHAMDARGLWQGRTVYVLDGSTMLLPAEPALIEHYGRHTNQHGQAHWPIMRFVAAFDLHSAALERVAEGPLRTSEQALAAEVLQGAPAGVLYLADRNFGVFSVVQAVHHHAADIVVRLTVTRAHALAPQRLQPGTDLPLAWAPSAHDTCVPDLPRTPIPGRLIYVRLVRDGFRPIELYLFTTVLDAAQYPVAALAHLYGRRWHVELDLRYVKTALDLHTLTGKSVDMVRKELVSGLLAYNLIRGLMALAARRVQLSPLTLSFTRCRRRIADTARSVPCNATPAQIEAVLDRLLTRLAACQLPKRKPFRIEPRAVRGRPATFPRLKGPRERARQSLLVQLKEQTSQES